MRIGEVAQRAGVRRSLLRYYEGLGLLHPVGRVGGQRRYDESVLRRLAVIDVAKRAGLSLEEIRDVLDDAPMSERLREVAARRLPEIDALIDRAERAREWLRHAVACGCGTVDECELFADAGGSPAPRLVRKVPGNVS